MSVNSHHPRFSERLPEWLQLRDTYEGERQVKARRTVYLPPTSGMVADGFTEAAPPTARGVQAYNAYIKRAAVPGYVREAVQSMVGIMHTKPPVIELPEALEPMRELATLGNESLEMLLRRVNEEQLITGRVGMLLDAPTLPTLLAPNGKPALPYVAVYKAESIINWDDGERDKPKPEALNLVVLDETEEVRGADDPFTWETKQRHRVLMLGPAITNEGADAGSVYRVAVVDDDAEFNESEAIEPKMRGNTLERTPFVFANTKDVVAEPDRAPLIDLSNLVLTIYRCDADYRQALFGLAQDTLLISGGEEEKEYRTGVGACIVVPQGGDGKFIGTNSQGIPSLRDALNDDHGRASARSGELLSDTGRAKESGEALHVRVAARTTTLRSIAISGAFALQEILRIAATWIGADPNAVKVTPNLDFVDSRLGAAELVELMEAKALGAPLSLESIHRTMLERGMTEKTWDEELEAIEGEGDLAIAPKPTPNEDGPTEDDEEPDPDEAEDPDAESEDEDSDEEAEGDSE